MFEKKSTDGLAPLADKLNNDVVELRTRIKTLTIPPEKMVGGAAALIEEVGKTKITGEEGRYSHTDLYDFQVNVDGAQKIVDLLQPLTMKADPKLLQAIDRNLAAVDKILAKYKVGAGFASYDRVTAEDRTALQGPVTTLAEDLSKLRGTFGPRSRLGQRSHRAQQRLGLRSRKRDAVSSRLPLESCAAAWAQYRSLEKNRD